MKNYIFVPLVVIVVSVVLIYSSHRIDEKVAHQKKLDDKVNTLKTEYLEAQKQLNEIRSQESILNKLDSLGFIRATEPPILLPR